MKLNVPLAWTSLLNVRWLSSSCASLDFSVSALWAAIEGAEGISGAFAAESSSWVTTGCRTDVFFLKIFRILKLSSIPLC
jgi:hypothetical protein